MGITIKTNTRISKIKTTNLSLECIKGLISKLEEKINEAIELEIKANPKLETTTDNNYELFVQAIRDNLKLSISINCSDNDYFSDDINTITNDMLSKNISKIIIESSYIYRNTFNREPMNRFDINIDFSKIAFDDMKNTALASNESTFRVSGDNQTWVDGVYTTINDFFKENKLKRGWLHAKHAYDVLLLFIAFPTIFWLVHKLEPVIKFSFPNNSKIYYMALFVYVSAMLLFFFRYFYNFLKILFPYIEFDYKKKIFIHKTRWFLSFLMFAGIAKIFWDIIYYLKDKLFP